MDDLLSAAAETRLQKRKWYAPITLVDTRTTFQRQPTVTHAADLISSGAIYTPEMQTDLDDDEMRITFLGSAFPPTRRAQEMMSIFVEIGPWVENEGGGFGHAADSFVFDIGPGSTTNYNALGISPSRMNKVFISHLHGDHMGDLPSLYCFGPSIDRKFPLSVFSHSPFEPD